jgi:hypothetical protein
MLRRSEDSAVTGKGMDLKSARTGTEPEIEFAAGPRMFEPSGFEMEDCHLPRNWLEDDRAGGPHTAGIDAR